jgi:hypothetical protein
MSADFQANLFMKLFHDVTCTLPYNAICTRDLHTVYMRILLQGAPEVLLREHCLRRDRRLGLR